MTSQQKHKDDDHVQLGGQVSEDPVEYKKLAYIIGGVFLLASFLAWSRGFDIERFIEDFIAVYFISFATFKFMNLEEFSSSYQSYDEVAKSFPLWGYLFPFVEGVLGIAYLLYDQANFLNFITIVIMGVSIIGATKEYKNSSNIMSPFLGETIKLPISKVTLIENSVILLLAATLVLI